MDAGARADLERLGRLSKAGPANEDTSERQHEQRQHDEGEVEASAKRHAVALAGAVAGARS